MGWVTPLLGSTIGLDTAPLIYYIEEHPEFFATVEPFFEALAEGHLQVVTSIVTLLEVLVAPIRVNNVELANRYRTLLLNTAGLTVFPVTQEIAEIAAHLRATSNVRTPDSLHLATAIYAGAPHFLTNDGDLPHPPTLNVIGIKQLINGVAEE